MMLNVWLGTPSSPHNAADLHKLAAASHVDGANDAGDDADEDLDDDGDGDADDDGPAPKKRKSSTVSSSSTIVADSAALSFALMDARLATALLSRYTVQQPLHVKRVLTPWHRRLAYPAHARLLVPRFHFLLGTEHDWMLRHAAWFAARTTDRHLRVNLPAALVLEPTVPIASLSVGESRNGPPELGVASLASLLQHVPALTSLDISCMAAAVSSFVDAFAHLPNLRELRAECVFTTDEMCAALARTLRHVPRLTLLDVQGSFMSSDGCRAIARALRHVPNLTHLNVASGVNESMIGNAGFVALAKALPHVPHLRELYVGGNEETNLRGFLTLLRALRHVPELTVLDMSYLSVEEDGEGEGGDEEDEEVDEEAQEEDEEEEEEEEEEEGEEQDAELAAAGGDEDMMAMMAMMARQRAASKKKLTRALVAGLASVPELSVLDLSGVELGSVSVKFARALASLSHLSRAKLCARSVFSAPVAEALSHAAGVEFEQPHVPIAVFDRAQLFGPHVVAE